MNLNNLFTLLFALVSCIFVACSDSEVAGGSSDDAGIYAIKDLNVAGLTQKGPFAKGSAVTVQGVDCQTMELTEEKFTGSVKSDKGDYDIEGIMLSSPCAIFEVTGLYLDELTGKQTTEPVTLRSLVNLKDRKSVNVNVLTRLEYDRVVKLVSEQKKSFADAKKQAEKEILASFGFADGVAESGEFEDLNIFEKGDGNAALLAVSVLMQSDLKVEAFTERVNDVAADIAKDGEWNDSKVKTEIANWAASAMANGKLDSIRKNIESWGYADEVPAFEKFVDASAGLATLESSSFAVPCKTDSTDTCEYGELIDERDGQVYKTVKIGRQTWMAENLNYVYAQATDGSTPIDCCSGDSLQYCEKYGRLYTWSAAVDSLGLFSTDCMGCGYESYYSSFDNVVRGICPNGWHLPSLAEWNEFKENVGESAFAVEAQGFERWPKATNDFGFSAIPTGNCYDGVSQSLGYSTHFWSSVEEQRSTTRIDKRTENAYALGLSSDSLIGLSVVYKNSMLSVRCVKNVENVFSSSSASSSSSRKDDMKNSSSSVFLSSGEETSDSSVNSSSSVALAIPCRTDAEDNCEYGELIDERDGQVYKTVKIGSQVWMAENLNYETDNSYCYNDSSSYCAKYGRLYTWSAAMDSAGVWSDSAKGCGYGVLCSPKFAVQGVCPTGWHLPDTTDWQILITAAGGWENAGKTLKSLSGWLYFNSTDDYDFAALPGGFLYHSGMYDVVGSTAYLWTSIENTEKDYYAYSVVIAGDGIDSFTDGFKDNAYSIRCVKN